MQCLDVVIVSIEVAQFRDLLTVLDDWVTTFQRIPKLIDATLTEKGAKAITPRGETDVAKGTVFDDFDEWQDQHLWPTLDTTGDSDIVSEVDSLDVEISTSARASHLNHHVQDALVLKNEVLSIPNAAEKRHMEIRLPTNTTYQVGDYLAILPVNNIHLIGRVLLRFGIPWDATMTINKGSHTTIPMQQSMSVTIVLGTYVEMTAPASRKNLATILQLTSDDSIKSSLSELASVTPTPSVLELLESNPSIPIPFSTYLSMLPPMRIRQYSISSSPLADPTTASITYAVLDEGEASATVTDSSKIQLHQEHQKKGRLGVATSFLRTLPPGSKIQIAIKKSHASFHLPLDDSTTPILMIAAGTGIAPFRGFVQERAVKIAAGRERAETGPENPDPETPPNKLESTLAPALLFLGCHSPTIDLLYSTQLSDWEAQGAVKVFAAFSRAPELSANCKYAQDRVWAERELVSTLFDQGARVYICGSGRLGRGVKEVAGRIYRENVGRMRREEHGGEEVNDVTEEEAAKWWEGLRGERFSLDVFD
jgi:cytochrome P450 / NADPH-cytochrome P450 reductase